MRDSTSQQWQWQFERITKLFISPELDIYFCSATGINLVSVYWPTCFKFKYNKDFCLWIAIRIFPKMNFFQVKHMLEFHDCKKNVSLGLFTNLFWKIWKTLEMWKMITLTLTVRVTKSHVSVQYHNVFFLFFLSNTYKDDKVSLRGIIKTTGLQDSQLSRSSKYIQNLAS